VFLGIDIGSSRTKAVLVRQDGAVVAVASRDHAVLYPNPGWAEHDAEAIWWAQAASLARELTNQCAEPVRAVSIAGIGPCLLVTDELGLPLRPAILYGIDTRAEAEIQELTAQVRADGSQVTFTSQSLAPKLLWLRRHESELWSRTRRMFMAHSFVVHHLTGAYALDRHSASTAAPLYDRGRDAWDLRQASEIAPGLALPALLWPAEVAGLVTPRAADETGIPPGTPVAMGTLDAWMDAVSVGVRAPGDRVLDYGSTMVFIGVTGRPYNDPRMATTVGVFPGTFTVAAGTATAGALTTWFQGIVGGTSLMDLVEEATAVSAGCDGLLALPYFAGERAPIFDSKARGAILGLTMRHTRGHIYRALLESTAFAVRHLLESVASFEAPWGPLKAAGAGGSGGLWTQIVSDVTGESQLLSRRTLGACYGSAWLAAVASGHVSADEEWNETATIVQPDPRNAALYDRRYRMYRELYPATVALMHELAVETSTGQVSA
jgi:xylulokinase